MLNHRITVFAGHYGSGKTLVALNAALALRSRFEKVTLADLDIVNPYFRTQDYKTLLAARGIRLIVSEYAGSNAEMPGFPPEAASVFDDLSARCVLDVGGDDRGALALGRFSERLRGAETLMVINRYRPQTRTPGQTVELMGEIEAAARIRFTGLCHNSNLGADTALEDVLAARGYADGVSRLSGLPVAFTAVRRTLAAGWPDHAGPVLALDLP